MFSRPFRKHGVIPLATDVWGEESHYRHQNLRCSKRNARKCHHGKLRAVYSVHSACWQSCKQAQTKFLPGELMCRWSLFRPPRAKTASINGRRMIWEKWSQGEGSRVQLKRRPASHREAAFVTREEPRAAGAHPTNSRLGAQKQPFRSAEPQTLAKADTWNLSTSSDSWGRRRVGSSRSSSARS